MDKRTNALRMVLYACGGRRFVLTVLGVTLAPWLISKGVEPELVWTLCGLIAAFVLGESVRDGMDSLHKDTIIDGNQQVTSNKTRYEPGNTGLDPLAMPDGENKQTRLGFGAMRRKEQNP